MDEAGLLMLSSPSVPTTELFVCWASLLASISRELAFNDPDADNGEDGHSDRRGERGERNVELLVRHPHARSSAP